MVMNYFRLRRIEEQDFDAIVVSAGGQRAVPDECVEKVPNADFLLNEAVLELKITEEEGLQKVERQSKLAELFAEEQAGRPVVVVDPNLLDEDGRRKYYRILEGPIKTSVKKAAKQLDSTGKKLGGSAVRVLVAINNGYSALSHDEFKQVIVKCAKNDTSHIDYVVVGGMYHFSDTFDTYVICPFECVGITSDGEFDSFEQLKSKWDAFVEAEMTEVITRTENFDRQKYPVLDLEFDVGDKRLVKPAPQWGNPSAFFTNGRPRNNSTGIETCPPVGFVSPKFCREDWEAIKTLGIDEEFLRSSYEEWCHWREFEIQGAGSVLCPLVEMEVTQHEFDIWLKEHNYEPTVETFATLRL